MPAPIAPASPRVRLLPARAVDPPYDDEVGERAPLVDGTLALAFPSNGPTSIPLRLVPPASAPPAHPAADLPNPGRWARHLAQALVEVLAGARCASQLSPLASLPVLEHLERATGRFGRRPGRAPAQRPTISSVRVALPHHGVAEVCAVIDTGPRRRAMALRLEARDGRWLCTALEIG